MPISSSSGADACAARRARSSSNNFAPSCCLRLASSCLHEASSGLSRSATVARESLPMGEGSRKKPRGTSVASARRSLSRRPCSENL